MNRRELFKHAGVALPALAAVPSFALSDPDPSSTDVFDYNGWQIRWRDWSYCVNQDIYIGLWTARGNGRYLYSAYPGGYGETSEGSVLDTALELARRIAALPPAGVQGTKRAFSRLTHQSAQVTFDLGLAYEMESMGRPEVAEAIARLRG